MDALTTLEEDVLRVPDKAAAARVVRRRFRILYGIGIGSAAMLIALVTTVVVGNAVRESRRATCRDHLRKLEPAHGTDTRHITDGSSQTILVLETDTPVPWTKPDDLKWTKGEPVPRLASPHAGGAHAVFADGSIRFLRSTIEPQRLEAILTINGGEVLSGSG